MLNLTSRKFRTSASLRTNEMSVSSAIAKEMLASLPRLMQRDNEIGL